MKKAIKRNEKKMLRRRAALLSAAIFLKADFMNRFFRLLDNLKQDNCGFAKRQILRQYFSVQ